MRSRGAPADLQRGARLGVTRASKRRLQRGFPKGGPKGNPKGESQGQSQGGSQGGNASGLAFPSNPPNFRRLTFFFFEGSKTGVQNRGPKGGPKEGSQRGVKKGPNAICGIHVVRVFLLCIHISVTDKVICFETYRLANPFDVKL